MPRQQFFVAANVDACAVHHQHPPARRVAAMRCATTISVQPSAMKARSARSSAVRILKPADHPGERGLSDAGFADQRNRRSGWNAEIHAPEDFSFRPAHRHTFDPDLTGPRRVGPVRPGFRVTADLRCCDLPDVTPGP